MASTLKRAGIRAGIRAAHTQGERVRGARKGLAPKLSEAGLADQEQMLDQIFRVILEFSGNSGVGAARVAEVFAHAHRTVTRAPYRLSDARNFKVMVYISEFLKAWYTEPEYLDARGVPAPLPLSGARSVERLIRRFVSGVNAKDTARWLLAEGVLERRGPRHLVPLRRTLSFSQPNAMTLDRIPFIVQGLLSTVSHNTRAKAQGRDTRCERTLALEGFPLSEVPRFDWEVKRLVPMFLDQLESWASPYVKTAARKSQKTARVGVEMFSYVEGHARPKKPEKRL